MMFKLKPVTISWLRCTRRRIYINLTVVFCAIFFTGLFILQPKETEQVSITAVTRPEIIVMTAAYKNRQSYSMEELTKLGIRLAKPFYIPERPNIIQERPKILKDLLANSENEMKSRLRNLKDQCGKSRIHLMQGYRLEVQGYINTSRSFYCGEDHMGKVFWQQVIPIFTDNNASKDGDHAQKEKGYSFLFVTDPYWRLFTNYILFVFLPNTITWIKLRKNISETIRNDTNKLDENHSLCGSDVSFLEFVQYVTSGYKSNTKLDTLLESQSRVCRACNLKYTIIGKMESFFNDSMYIMNKFNKTDFLDPLTDAIKYYIDEFVYPRLRHVFQDNLTLMRCLNANEVYRRYWVGLQFLAVVTKDAEIPFSYLETFSLTINEFVKVVKSSSTLITDTNDYLKEKIKILNNAYGNIPPVYKMKIKSMFTDDFNNFGYKT